MEPLCQKRDVFGLDDFVWHWSLATVLALCLSDYSSVHRISGWEQSCHRIAPWHSCILNFSSMLYGCLLLSLNFPIPTSQEVSPLVILEWHNWKYMTFPFLQVVCVKRCLCINLSIRSAYFLHVEFILLNISSPLTKQRRFGCQLSIRCYLWGSIAEVSVLAPMLNQNHWQSLLFSAYISYLVFVHVFVYIAYVCLYIYMLLLTYICSYQEKIFQLFLMLNIENIMWFKHNMRW